MKNVSRTMLMVPLLATLLWIATGATSNPGQRVKAKTAPVSAPAPNKINGCGCYKDAAGACFCGKKGKCGCPGECEPKTCAEKNTKDMEREIKAETKRAQEAERKQKATASKRKTQDGPKSPEKAAHNQ